MNVKDELLSRGRSLFIVEIQMQQDFLGKLFDGHAGKMRRGRAGGSECGLSICRSALGVPCMANVGSFSRICLVPRNVIEQNIWQRLVQNHTG